MANITLRLHRQHDMDLIALYRTDDYKFARELKKVLVSYANGEVYEPKTLDATKFNEAYVPTSVTFHISLNEAKEEEKQALILLSGVKYGYRNSFLKALFRSSITYLPLVAFAKDSGFITKRGVFLNVRKQSETIAKPDTDIIPDAKINTETQILPVQANKDEHGIFENEQLNSQNSVPETDSEQEIVNEDEFSDLFNQMSMLNHL